MDRPIPNASDIGLGIVGLDDLESPEPGISWWTGWTSCSACGRGTEGHEVPRMISVIPIPEGQSGPFLMECPGCRNMTLSPDD